LKITIKAFATLRDAFGGRGFLTIELPEGSSIEDLIRELQNLFKLEAELVDLGKSASNIKILVNGREIRYLEGVKTKLKDGDVVAFIPPVGGG